MGEEIESDKLFIEDFEVVGEEDAKNVVLCQKESDNIFMVLRCTHHLIRQQPCRTVRSLAGHGLEHLLNHAVHEADELILRHDAILIGVCLLEELVDLLFLIKALSNIWWKRLARGIS